ncbi:MAG: hypothetical protein H5T86_14425, partial [Armatimonadetes bacterium]|nr:hypothetical protein [Armatimonadota bacterium]
VQLRSVEDTERQRALAALQAITGGDIEVAEDQIRALAETDAASELIANLRLLSAEAEAPRRPRSAAQKLEALAQASPNCSAAPYALYLAATYLEADEPAQALRLAEGLLRDYPDTALGPLVTRLMERARQRTNSSTEKG